MQNLHKPILLKTVLEDAHVGITRFSNIIKENTGEIVSRSSIYNLLNKGEIPKKINNFKQKIENIIVKHFQTNLTNLNIQAADIWQVISLLSKEEQVMEKSVLLQREAMEHFKLQIDPFMPIYTSDKDIIMLQAHYNALENMRITAELGLMTAITGQVGSGKSTVRIKFKSTLKNNDKYILVQPKTQEINRVTTREILEAILRKVTEEKPKRNLESLSQQVYEALVNVKNQGKRLVLLIEEAQDLHSNTLKRLKRLWEMRDEDDEITPLISIILIGQNELAYRLYGSQNMYLREVASRITHVELHAINNELYDYINHKLKKAGIKIDNVITREAVDMLSSRFTKKDLNGKNENIAYPNAINNKMKELMNMVAVSGEELITKDIILMETI